MNKRYLILLLAIALCTVQAAAQNLKYVFLFIGDGMGMAQVDGTEMFLAEKDAKYVDVAEVALYNNVLAGVNLDGNRFFYVNPLEVDGPQGFNQGVAGRSPWFGTACCPSNLARLVPQISGMMYAHTSDEIYCTLYAGNKTVIPLESGNVDIEQITNYPFDETIRFHITPQQGEQTFALRLRIPTWAMNQFVPGDLYDYVDNGLMRSKFFQTNKPSLKKQILFESI